MKCLELLFPKAESTKTSLILLASRLVFGLTFASHGLDKLQHFSETAAHFPAPFGLSGEVAVGLSIFGEFSMRFGIRFWFPHTFSTLANDFHHDSCLHNCVWRIYQCR